jgi:hypothetical protein
MTMDFIQHGLFRWIHIMAGRHVDRPPLLLQLRPGGRAEAAGADTPPTGAGITKHVAPRALLFFRWAAVVTVVMGIGILGDKWDEAFFFKERAYVPIGIGAWLGSIMLFNVWVLIWPNQKKILGIVPGHRRGEEQGAPRGVPRIPDQRRAVDPDAVLHVEFLSLSRTDVCVKDRSEVGGRR